MESKEQNQVKILKDQESEPLENEQLEEVTGGECTCDCWIGNSNAGTKKDFEEQKGSGNK